MSTTNLELITCNLCQRKYHIDVYQRHRNENQCIKRNQSRKPFQSIKQRSIQIGDQILPVEFENHSRDKKQKPPIQISLKARQEKLQRILPSNHRRRTLEQAKQLLERRIKYKPPLSNKNQQSKVNRMNTMALSKKERSYHTSNSVASSTVLHSKYKNDDLPAKNICLSISKQPILISSTKTRTRQVLKTSQNVPIQEMNQIEQNHSASRPTRKANTWTRTSQQSINRDNISPIQIPTFHESSSSNFHTNNVNYDDDDEFERYSPSLPSTPKYPSNETILPSIIRPKTYKKSKLSENTPIYVSPQQLHRQKTHSTFHLPPIKHRPKVNRKPWR